MAAQEARRTPTFDGFNAWLLCTRIVNWCNLTQLVVKLVKSQGEGTKTQI